MQDNAILEKPFEPSMANTAHIEDAPNVHRQQYTVGWICALSTEATAAQAMLDETYPGLPSKNIRDSNVYTFGRVHNHKVVIALLPSGIIGTNSAATTAKEMLLNFPNIRFGLLVGVGGGIPSEEHDIRLGDVVVSKPYGTIGAVLQFDLGKETSTGFERTGSLDKPPSMLLKAIALLESRHALHGSKDVPRYVMETFEKFPKYKAKHPGLEQDRLFEADYEHPNAQSSTCQRCDVTQIVNRDARETQDPVIHYGPIGSGNRVIKSSRARDLLGEQNILCVEMEASGLMNDFPCLVIRGICDYCDSHKNKRWQPYAALAAAAYAKELLGTIPVLEVEAAPVALDIIQEIVECKEDLKEIAQYSKESHQERYVDRIRRWLSPADPHTNYIRALDMRQSGSGTWFLQSQQYLQWKSSLEPTLWLHGLAGCGKTVLTSSIVEDVQKEIVSGPHASSSPILLYFFFDFRDIQKQSFGEMALSLAYQLYSQDKSFEQPLDSLLKACDNGYRKPSTASLLEIILETLLSIDRKVCIILDALDECAIPRQELLAWIQKVAESTSKRINLLVTSRKEPDIDSVLGRARSMDQNIAVQTDVVDEDIRAYIIHRLRTGSEFKRWEHREDIQQMIQESLMRMSAGMFRWASCQLDALSRCVSPLELSRALDALPPTLDDTYARMLKSIPQERRYDCIRLLQLLVYSNRPLSLTGAVDALAVDLTAKPYFDPRKRTPIPSEIIVSCSSLITIERIQGIYHYSQEVLQLAHFSVQQYLKSEKVDPDWKHCMSEQHARGSNAKVCLAYCFQLQPFHLDFDNIFPRGGMLDTPDAISDWNEYLGDQVQITAPGETVDEDTIDRPFTATAAIQWPEDAMAVEAHDAELYAMIQEFLLSDELEQARFGWLLVRVSYTKSSIYPDWLEADVRPSPADLGPLVIASMCGLYHTVESFLLCGADPNKSCPGLGPALYGAVLNSHYEVARLLLDSGARPNMESGRAELSVAISCCSPTKLPELFHALLRHGANVNACDEKFGLPLLKAIKLGEEKIINALLAKGADAEAVYKEHNALRVAAAEGNNKIVRKLLEYKAEVNSEGLSGGSALFSACAGKHKEVVRTLLENGALVCQQFDDSLYKNALEVACCGADEETFELLIEYAARDKDFDKRESLSRCLSLACSGGHEKIVRLLLIHGADVNAQHDGVGTPLAAACVGGHEQIVQLLLYHGSDANQASVTSSKNSPGSLFRGTPLLHLVNEASKENIFGIGKDYSLLVPAWIRILKILIAAGADVDTSDDQDQTSLHYAATLRSTEFSRILIEAGAIIEKLDERRQTPLLKAAEGEVEDFWFLKNIAAKMEPERHTRLLLEAGAKTDIQDIKGRTALHYAAMNGWLHVCTELVEAEAVTDLQDVDHRTALHHAAYYGSLEICTMLVEAGARMNIQDICSKAALHFAAFKGYAEICEMLVKAGADLDLLDSEGYTPLQLAEQEDHFEIVAFFRRFLQRKSVLIAVR